MLPSKINAADRVNQKPKFYAVSAESALLALESGPGGLSQAEAERRRREFGANRLTPQKRRGPLLRFLSQFQNVLVYVLVLAAVVTAVLGHWIDCGVITAAIMINAAIGFLQEGRAERALDAIRGLLAPCATVLRDGRRVSLPAEELVRGDIVHVASGDKIPADLRLIHSKGLSTQEALLTGESLPVEKQVTPVSDEASLVDRASMAYAGTIVASGQATGVVVSIGDASEIGKVGTLIAEVKPLATPLVQRMTVFGRWLSAAILALATVTFATGTWIHGLAPADMFMAAVGLAVAAIPEGLPAILAITLAIGVERMAQRNAIVRHLGAVETLGSVNVICADKTGTFTRNEMTVQRIVTAADSIDVTGSGYAPYGEFLSGGSRIEFDASAELQLLARGVLLCSDADVTGQADAWQMRGDPMEAALVTLALKGGLDPDHERKAWPRTDEIPFESEHRFNATLNHDHEGNAVIVVKGAPEQLIRICPMQRRGADNEPIDQSYWDRQLATMTAESYRVLALAMKPTSADQRALNFSDLDDGLVLLGFFGLTDPPRQEAIEAVAQCRQAGIQVKMITGDHVGTAQAIAAQLGFENSDRIRSGNDLDRLDSGQFQEAALETDIFARTSPEHKLRLVSALQADNRIVAMTGDGVNDAPALRRANVGIAMGRYGSEAAKEASEMVLTDDNFATIVEAIKEGRIVSDNLKKAILFILPNDIGEAFTIVVAVALGHELPITALQILWVNMITAVTLALALAFEKAEPDVMSRPASHSTESLLSPLLIWRTVFVSSIFVAAVFGIFLWLENDGANTDMARTAAVNTLVFLEVFYLFNVRRLQASGLRNLSPRDAPAIWIAIADGCRRAAPLYLCAFHADSLPNSASKRRDLGCYSAGIGKRFCSRRIGKGAPKCL